MKRTAALVNEKYWENFLATLSMVASIAAAAIVDRIMVGNFLGGTALAALNLTDPIVEVINIVFGFFVFGGNTLAVMRKAERDSKGANRAFTIAIAGGALVMSFVAFLEILFRSRISIMLCVNNDTLCQPVLDYLTPLAVFGVLVILLNGTSAFVRVDGMQKLAVIIPIVANVSNLFFDYVFMGILHWGIASAGWATNLGYLVGMLFLMQYFRSEMRTFFFDLKGLTDFPLIRETMRTGLASAMVDVCLFIQAYSMNSAILICLGATGAEVAAVCLSANSIAAVIHKGTTQTLLPIGGALYGEKDYNGLKSVMRTCFILTEALLLATAALLCAVPRPFGAVFGVRSEATLIMMDTGFRLYLVSLPFVGMMEWLRVCLQATKRSYAATVLVAISGTVCFVPVLLLLAALRPGMLWLALAIAPLLAVCFCLGGLSFRSHGSGDKTGILFPEEADDAWTHDFSIPNTVEGAEEASARIIALCREQGVDGKAANNLGVAAEELCTNIAKYAYGDRKDSVDIFLRIDKKELLLRIRDNGVIFNPVEFVSDSGEEIHGLKVLGMLPAEKEYNRVLGFNNTIITIPAV